jgi:hypothetical protein
MTRLDFGASDFAAGPTQTLFAAGGFRGDAVQAGPDGCLYVTQVAVRYADATVSLNERGLVRICGGFSVLPDIRGAVVLAPSAVSAEVGFDAEVWAVVRSAEAATPDVRFEILGGPNAGLTASLPIPPNGQVAFRYRGLGGAGVDLVEATVETAFGVQASNRVPVEWAFPGCALDCNANSVPDDCEIEGRDCNNNGVLDDCDGGCGR